MFSPLRGFPESTKQEIEIDGKGNYGKGVRYVDSYCSYNFLYAKIFIKMLGVGKKKKIQARDRRGAKREFRRTASF